MNPRRTLATLWQHQLDEVLADPHEPRQGENGARGWLLDAGVPDVIDPYLTEMPASPSGLVGFAGLDAAGSALLLERLPVERLADRSDDAPTLGALLLAAVRHPVDLELHGYLVGPGRLDERLTVEGLFVYVVGELMMPPDVERDLGLHAGRGPDEILRRTNPWRPNEDCWSLRWVSRGGR
ncbi:hypothetical protein [Actinotalea sp. K2]|uniref:hypothetical protein n=1 Tax=Actinotalea sp. K2 TaxID=2939438 RepID=UPI00201768DE|nr:hypothetical protein [Actinotalea sp. K2]MCL3860961.1 hypothetical protein [Actinotalea sp. K2]